MGDTPITDAEWQAGCCSGEAWYRIAERMKNQAADLERTMTQIFHAYKQKVKGEIEMCRFDKGALALIVEMQRKYPHLAEKEVKNENRA